MYWPEAEADDDAVGAMTVELAPLPAAIRVDSPEIAHGPLQEEERPTLEAAKEAVQEVEKDIPPVPPSPAPEVALPRPQEEKEKPKTEQAQEAVMDKERPQQERETAATAPPRVDAQPVPSSAPSQGLLSPSLARAKASWENALSRQLNRHKRVPKAALGRRGQWEAVVAFTVDRSGRVMSAELKKSTGVPVLDKEALEWLQRTSPFPPPPNIPEIELYFTQTLKFDVK